VSPRTLARVAGWYLTIVAAGLTGWAVALLLTGYHGAGLAWLGGAALVCTATGVQLDRHGLRWPW
jgi:hypothetical protein